MLTVITTVINCTGVYSIEKSISSDSSQINSATIFLPDFCDKTSIRDDELHVNYELYIPVADDVNLISTYNLIDLMNLNTLQLISKIPEEYNEGDTIYSYNNVRLKKIDSSYSLKKAPVFTLRRGMIIEGFEQGLYDMCVGEKRILIVPPELAYGNSGIPGLIPAKSTVVFFVELVKIERKIPKKFRLN